jgi:hypothetical protein
MIMAIADDPHYPIHDHHTRGQIEHARQACRRATGRWPWRSMMSIDGDTPRIVERHLYDDVIDDWAAACFAALHAARRNSEEAT